MTVTAQDFVPGAAPGVVPTPVSLLRPDVGTLFRHRAERLRHAAAGHPIGDFLSFIAVLADAQHRLTPLAGGGWQAVLPPLLDLVLAVPGFPDAVTIAARDLAAADLTAVEQRLQRWLGGAPDLDDLAGAPFVAAALQVARGGMAAGAEPDFAEPGRCPLCGGAPVASTVATHNGVSGVRYLHCGLCAAAWHLDRLRCPGCGGDDKVVHHRLDQLGDDVAAETCGACGTYLKLLQMDGHPDWEPLAEDLMSFALDLRLAEDGWRRLWPNPFLHAA